MALYPDAIQKPVERYKPGGSSFIPMPNPRRLCLHTADSPQDDSLFAGFNISGNPVAHFFVRENGRVEQYVDTDTRASANLDGNHDTISVESWDDDGRRHTWTADQVEAVAKLAVWVHEMHDIPLERCPSSKPGTKGIAWHRLGVDGDFPDPPGRLLGGRVSGGERWSEHIKECPFDGKIRGIVDDIIPRARELLKGDWFDMATKAELREVVDKALAADHDEIRKIVDAAVEDERERLIQRLAKHLLDEVDLFPNDTDRELRIRNALIKAAGD
ncbi:MAG TPA: N-acetylmuramoyl-L-alanine amidase [Nocardioidaceae bacterium]|nr:N-acetylmuramoyl-L-alanine amidase [Nocardioidaceae bacterium]